MSRLALMVVLVFFLSLMTFASLFHLNPRREAAFMHAVDDFQAAFDRHDGIAMKEALDRQIAIHCNGKDFDFEHATCKP